MEVEQSQLSIHNVARILLKFI